MLWEKGGSFLGGHPSNIQLCVRTRKIGPAIPVAKTVHQPVHCGPNMITLLVNVNMERKMGFDVRHTLLDSVWNRGQIDLIGLINRAKERK